MTIPAESAAPAGKRWIMIVSIALATLVSFAFSGYIPLYKNNFYHLTILFGAYDLPQFQTDAYVQSLRNFSSGFWIVFADTARFIDPKLFLGLWLVVCHFIFFGACVHFARSLGYRDPRFLSALALLLPLVSLTIGGTLGAGGIVLESFTHSELANAAMVMTFSFALSKRYGYALFFACVTFFLNAFMAVWAAGPVLALAAYHLGSGQLSLRELVMRALPGSIGLVLLVPVLASILGNHEGLAATDFSYPDYLWDFFPAHFFLSAAGTMSLVEGAALVAVLVLTLGAHGQARAGLLALGLGAAAVLLLGVVASMVTDARSILNLHLIRSFVMLHLLAELSLLLFALKRIRSADARNDRAIGAVTAALLFLPRPLWIAVLPVLLFDRSGGREWQAPQRYRAHLRIALLLLLAACVAALPVRIYRKLRFTQAMTGYLANWEEIGRWANGNTSPSARFLIAEDGERDSLLGFSYTAARQVWVTYQYGAAVMWSPSYHPTWKTRWDSVRSLTDLESMRAYARAQGIDYIAARCVPGAAEIHRYQNLCVYEGAPASK